MTPTREHTRRALGGVGIAGLFLCVLTGILMGLGAHTFHFAEGASYLSNDPNACINCHVMRDQHDGWLKASHHAHATCNDCHVPHDSLAEKYLVKGVHGFRHSKGFTLQDFHEPIRIRAADLAIVDRNCIRCHEGLVHEITIARPAPQEAVACVHCHATVGHGPSR